MVRAKGGRRRAKKKAKGKGMHPPSKGQKAKGKGMPLAAPSQNPFLHFIVYTLVQISILFIVFVYTMPASLSIQWVCGHSVSALLQI